MLYLILTLCLNFTLAHISWQTSLSSGACYSSIVLEKTSDPCLETFLCFLDICLMFLCFSHPDLADPGMMTADDVSIMAFLPFFHVYGMMVIMTGSLFGGRKIITLPRFEPILFLSSIQKNKVSKYKPF